MIFTGSIEINLDPAMAGVVSALARELDENRFLAGDPPLLQAVSIVANHAEGLSRLISRVPTGTLSWSINLDEPNP